MNLEHCENTEWKDEVRSLALSRLEQEKTVPSTIAGQYGTQGFLIEFDKQLRIAELLQGFGQNTDVTIEYVRNMRDKWIEEAKLYNDSIVCVRINHRFAEFLIKNNNVDEAFTIANTLTDGYERPQEPSSDIEVDITRDFLLYQNLMEFDEARSLLSTTLAASLIRKGDFSTAERILPNVKVATHSDEIFYAKLTFFAAQSDMSGLENLIKEIEETLNNPEIHLKQLVRNSCIAIRWSAYAEQVLLQLQLDNNVDATIQKIESIPFPHKQIEVFAKLVAHFIDTDIEITTTIGEKLLGVIDENYPIKISKIIDSDLIDRRISKLVSFVKLFENTYKYGSLVHLSLFGNEDMPGLFESMKHGTLQHSHLNSLLYFSARSQSYYSLDQMYTILMEMFPNAQNILHKTYNNIQGRIDFEAEKEEIKLIPYKERKIYSFMNFYVKKLQHFGIESWRDTLEEFTAHENTIFPELAKTHEISINDLFNSTDSSSTPTIYELEAGSYPQDNSSRKPYSSNVPQLLYHIGGLALDQSNFFVLNEIIKDSRLTDLYLLILLKGVAKKI